MNCEICKVTFTRLKDLMQHVTSEGHVQTHLYCIACALPLYSVADIAEHISSKEHFITVLATGVRFETGHDPSDFSGGSSPPHNSCFLCSNRDGTPNDAHLTFECHKYTTWLLRTIIQSKKLYSNDPNATLSTQVLVSKLINLKRGKVLVGSTEFQRFRGSLAFVCELCNIHFNNKESHELHLKDQSHKRMEKFLIELSKILKDVNVVGYGFHWNARKTFSNSLRPLYNCDVCSMWIDTVFNYVQHRKSNKHKRVELTWRRSNRMKLADVKPNLADTKPSCAAFTSAAHSYPKHESRQKDDVSRDCQAEKSSKRLRLSPSPHKHCSSVCGKHKKKLLKKVVKKRKCHCCRSRGTVSNSSSSGDSDESESTETSPHRGDARNSTPRHRLGATRSSASPLGLDAAKNYASRLETARNSTPRIKQKTSEPATSYFPRPSRELNEATGSSSLRPGYEVAARNSSHRLEDGEVKDDQDTEDDQEHYCELCEYLTYNPLHYEKHLMGEQHKRMRKLINKKERKVSADTPAAFETSGQAHPLQYNCELCDVLNRNSQEYEFHLGSAVHRKNQWLLYVIKQRPL